MRSPIRRGGPVCDFDRTVTSMVDIVFQLLVFFVLASGGRLAEQCLATKLAAGTVAAPAESAADDQPAELWIHLKRDGDRKTTVMEVQGQRFADPRAFAAAVSETTKAVRKGAVILDVASDVPLGDVVFVYDTCRAAQFPSINFSAAPEEIASRINR